MTERFNIAVNNFDVRESACCRQLLVVSELVVSGTQGTYFFCLVHYIHILQQEGWFAKKYFIRFKTLAP